MKETQTLFTLLQMEVAYAALKQESVDRLEQINTIEIQFQRQFECHVANQNTHPQLVYQLRSMIFAIEDVYEGTSDYFKDLKMEFIYALFRKIQVLMVNGYNFLAQALLTHIDQAQIERELKQQFKNREKLMMKDRDINKGQDKTKALQSCDYTITFLEAEEAKIQEEMHKIQDHLLLSRDLVEKLAPSKAVKELTEIKERSEITLQNSQRIFEETYHLKYLQFKNYLASLQKPDDLTRQFCQNIKISVREKFTEGVKKSVNTLYTSVKQQYIQHLVTSETQTEEEIIQGKNQKKALFKPGQKIQNLLLKERKITQKLQHDVASLHKDIDGLKLQRNKLKSNLQQLTQKHTNLSENYEVLTKLYQQRRQQLAKMNEDMSKQGQSILQLRAIQARYYRQNPKKDHQTQVAFKPRTRDQEVTVKLDDQGELVKELKAQIHKLQQQIEEAKELKTKRALRGDSQELKLSKVNLTYREGTSKDILKPKKIDSSNKRSSLQYQTFQESPMRLLTRKKSAFGNQFQSMARQGNQTTRLKHSRHNSANSQVDSSKSSSHQCSPIIQELGQSKHSEVRPNKKQRRQTKKRSTFIMKSLQLEIPEEVEKPIMIEIGVQTVNFQPEAIMPSQKPTDAVQGKKTRKDSKQRTPSALDAIPFETFQRKQKLNKTMNPFKKKDLNAAKSSPHHLQNSPFDSSSSKPKTSRFNFKNKRRDTCQEENQLDQTNQYQQQLTKEHFQQLNIQCQEPRSTMQKKRTIIAKNSQFLISTNKPKNEEENDKKHATFDQQAFRVGRQAESERKKTQTSRQGFMLAVDKMTLKGSGQSKDKLQKKQLTMIRHHTPKDKQDWAVPQRQNNASIF